MKYLLAILTATALAGCATITLDVPTRIGRATLTTDGSAVLFGLTK